MAQSINTNTKISKYFLYANDSSSDGFEYMQQQIQISFSFFLQIHTVDYLFHFPLCESFNLVIVILPEKIRFAKLNLMSYYMMMQTIHILRIGITWHLGQISSGHCLASNRNFDANCIPIYLKGWDQEPRELTKGKLKQKSP